MYARDGLSNPSPGGWIWRSSRNKVRLLSLLFEKIRFARGHTLVLLKDLKRMLGLALGFALVKMPS